MQKGEAKGTIIGGNLSVLSLLQGSEYFPDLSDSILFIEDDYESHAAMFSARLQSLIHLPSFPGVRGIVIGRFQEKSGMTDEKLAFIIQTKKELAHLPIIAGVDFGHTLPMITFPIGGRARISVDGDNSRIEITEH